MAKSNNSSETETFTFRLESELKREFLKLADKQDKPAGEILREYVRELVKCKRELDFAKEARRQSMIIAAAAADPQTDEAELLKQLDQSFDEFVAGQSLP